MKIRHFVILFAISLLITACNETKLNLSDPFSKQAQSPAALEPKALNILEQALSSEDGPTRSIAAEMVASSNQRQLMHKVMALLEDEYIAIRFAAAIAIGDTKYKPAEEALKKMFKDSNPNAQIAAAYALTKLGNYKFRTVVINAINSSDQTVRANAALLIGKLGDKADLKLLYAAINDVKSSDKVRMQAVESIAMLGDEKIYKKLWALFVSKYVDDRVIGVRAMGMLNTPDALNSIFTKLKDEDPWVRLTAAEQLAIKGDDIGKELLLAHLRTMPSSLTDNKIINADITAVSAIGRFKDTEITAFLPSLLDSQSSIIRLNAAWSVLLLNN